MVIKGGWWLEHPPLAPVYDGSGRMLGFLCWEIPDRDFLRLAEHHPISFVRPRQLDEDPWDNHFYVELERRRTPSGHCWVRRYGDPDLCFPSFLPCTSPIPEPFILLAIEKEMNARAWQQVARLVLGRS